jgi:hypothetical protein
MLTLLPTGADGHPTALRCPRCEREVAPEDLEASTLDELRLIDPHVDRYAHQAAHGEIAVCVTCGHQLEAMAAELDAARQRLVRCWPTPASKRVPLMKDQRLSRPFEAVRDTSMVEVLALAIWHARHGATAYLTVFEDGDWTIHAVQEGQDAALPDERDHLSVAIPVAPGAAALPASAGAAQSADVLYRHCITTQAAHAALERELATRFYRTLYGQAADQ